MNRLEGWRFNLLVVTVFVVAAWWAWLWASPNDPQRGPFGDSPAVTTEVSYPRQSLPRSVP